MTPEDFFVDGGLLGQQTLDREFLDRLRSGEDVGRSGVEVGVALLRLAHDELEAYGTSGTWMSEDDIRLILRTCRSLLERTGIDLDLPFSDFQTFHSYWKENGAYGSWQARRDILNDLFGPAHLELTRREDNALVSSLVRPITRHPGTGWSRVDNEITELRRHFAAARSPQDYRNVGTTVSRCSRG